MLTSLNGVFYNREMRSSNCITRARPKGGKAQKVLGTVRYLGSRALSHNSPQRRLRELHLHQVEMMSRKCVNAVRTDLHNRRLRRLRSSQATPEGRLGQQYSSPTEFPGELTEVERPPRPGYTRVKSPLKLKEVVVTRYRSVANCGNVVQEGQS